MTVIFFQVEEELQQINNAKTIEETLNGSSGGKKSGKRRRESHVSADTLLSWFQRQLESYDCLAVTDMTYSFQSGLALCAIIHRYRPDLVDFQVKLLLPRAIRSNFNGFLTAPTVHFRLSILLFVPRTRSWRLTCWRVIWVFRPA